MAYVQVYQTLDMLALDPLQPLDGKLQTAAADRIVFEDENGYDRAIFEGHFTYKNGLPSGTADAFTLTYGNTPVFGASGLDASMSDLYALLQPGQPLPAIQAALNGNDFVQGSSGNDIVGGFAGDDTITGGYGDDQIQGGMGADYLVGNPGNDLIHGNMGNDFIFGGEGDDALHGNFDNDQLYGGLGMDALYGEHGNDFLSGNRGNDYLEGGIGNDTLNGGVDDDTLKGGEGSDVFTFIRGNGNDVAVDFNAAEGDRINLKGQEYHLTAGADGIAVLELDGGGTVKLFGLTMDTFSDDLII